MPRIKNPAVLELLKDEYFEHHMAMHLARERLTLPDGAKLMLFLPECACDDCKDMDKMKEAGTPGSGAEFLMMHHEMLRVFRYFLECQQVRFLPEWHRGAWHYLDGDLPGRPVLWNLEAAKALPEEIRGLFEVDYDYLDRVFDGVAERTRGADRAQIEGAVDELGRFLERGINQHQHPDREPDGSGFHNTLHTYLGAKEGPDGQGAEMSRLRNSVFNVHFWSLHLWIDAQYGRLLERSGLPFYTDALPPTTEAMLTHPAAHGEMTGMSMPS